MKMNANDSHLNGSNYCKCCPYGYHIDVDFVNYCESLLTAYYGAKRSHSYRNRTTPSLNRRFNSLSSTSSLHSVGPYHEFRELNSLEANNNGSRRNQFQNLLKPVQKSKSSTFSSEYLRSFSHPPLNAANSGDDSSLNDAVAKFEKVFNEQQSFNRYSKKGNFRSEIKASSDFDQIPLDSPPASPSPSCASSIGSNINRTSLAQIRDQMALSLQKMKELEQQVKHVPLMKQKIIVLREERKKLIDKINNDLTSGELNPLELQGMGRVKELERSGLITPPLMRRKHLLKSSLDSDSDGEAYEKAIEKKFTSPCNLISSKNIGLQSLNEINFEVGTQTSFDFQQQNFPSIAFTNSVATNTTNKKTATVYVNTDEQLKTSTNLAFNILEPTVINPDKFELNTPKRSIGTITTNNVPSLPLKNISINTDMLMTDRLFSRPDLKSFGTDAMKPETNRADFICQFISPSRAFSTQTEDGKTADFGMTFRSIDSEENTKIHDKILVDKHVQVTSKCSVCELKQTETIGVGDFSVNVSDQAINTEMFLPVSRASSSQSIKLCDKCNDSFSSSPKEFIKDKTLSPTISKIPRFSHPISPTENRTITQDRIIIEESPDEILVYRNPASIDDDDNEPKSTLIKPTRQLKISISKIKEENEEAENDEVTQVISDSDSGDESDESCEEASYDVESRSITHTTRTRIEPSKEMKAALKVLNDNLIKPERSNKSAIIKSTQLIEKEWFKISSQNISDSGAVEDYLDCFEKFSKHLLNQVVNVTDGSGNTAMHYAISHSNFDIVTILLDSKVCDVNKQNKAGYTAIMLVSLSHFTNETQKEVIRRLFQMGDVNVRAKQNGQTALMLAASHGHFITCKLLLECGSAINVQDNDGSTALMCATEHGHIEVVRLLLSHPDCDPSVSDNDGSTALGIAMQGGHKDIGLMLYAATNMFSRGSSPYASLRRNSSKAITSTLKRTNSFSSRPKLSSRTFQLASSPPSKSRHSSNSSTTSEKF